MLSGVEQEKNLEPRSLAILWGPQDKKTCPKILTRLGSNQPAQLQRLARILKFGM